MAARKRATRRPLIIYMGGVGYPGELQLEKTLRYAKRFPGFKFEVIDLREFKGRKPGNVKTRVADFKKGLEKKRNGTVDLITSELALGLYGHGYEDCEEHSLRAFKAAHRKLRKGGKLMFVIDGLMQKEMRESLVDAGFKGEKITMRRLRKLERQRTHWTRNYEGFLYQAVAVK